MTRPRVDQEEDRTWHLAERELKATERYLSVFLEPLSLRDGATFVDVGCGGGYINQFVAQRYRMKVNVGLDLFPDTVALARDLNRQTDGIDWVCASAEALAFPRASVDFLVCRGVIPLADVHRVIDEVGQVLRRGATAVFLLHSWTFYLGWLSLDPRRWKHTLAGILHFLLGLWFNATGRQHRVRWRGRTFGQTFQTEFRMRRLLREYGMTLERVVTRPEFLVYLRKTG